MLHTPQELIGQAERRLDEGGRAAAADLLDEALVRGADQVWVHRHVAALWRTRLGDRARAAEVLAACERRLGAGAPTGSEWRLLAEGWLQILGDRDAARRCLLAAEQGAQTVDDLCSAAVGFAGLLGDEGRARALLTSAEQRARALHASRHGGRRLEDAEPASAWWNVANGWREALGDCERAQRCFAAALEHVEDAAGCEVLARGVASHDLGAARIRACLQRGRELASRFEEFSDLAAAADELLRDAELVRELLTAAEPLATAPGARQQLARAFRDWLGDAERAERVGPVGVRPADWLGPPAAHLFDWLRARVTDDALTQVAGADYGQDRDRHLGVLRDIVASGLVPTPLQWHPIEVCRLYSWSDPDDCDHAARALCCVLIVHQDAGGSGDGSIESTWAVLLESSGALGQDALAMLVGLADAMAAHQAGWPDDQALACLCAFLARVLHGADEPAIVAAAARFLAACDRQEDHRLPAHLATDPLAHVWGSLFAAALARLPVAPGAGPLAAVRAALAGFVRAE